VGTTLLFADGSGEPKVKASFKVGLSFSFGTGEAVNHCWGRLLRSTGSSFVGKHLIQSGKQVSVRFSFVHEER